MDTTLPERHPQADWWPLNLLISLKPFRKGWLVYIHGVHPVNSQFLNIGKKKEIVSAP